MSSASRLASMLHDPDRVHLRAGVVTAVNGDKVSVNVAGTVVADIPVAGTVPAVGARARILATGNQAVVLAGAIAGGARWHTIADETLPSTTSTYDVAIPPSTFSRIRMSVQGGVSVAAEQLFLRINGDSTASLHRNSWRVVILSTGALTTGGAADGTAWILAEWGAVLGNSFEGTIYRTDTNTDLTFQGSGYRPTTGVGLRRYTLSGGGLSANRLVSSLRFGATGGSSLLAGTQILIEGHGDI